MTSIDVSMKRHNVVMFGDIAEHILPSNSAEEGLINYSIFNNYRNNLLANFWHSG